MVTEKKLLLPDLVRKSIKQLVELRNALRKELFDYKLGLALRKLNKPHLITLARKNIARVNTALKHKVIG